MTRCERCHGPISDVVQSSLCPACDATTTRAAAPHGPNSLPGEQLTWLWAAQRDGSDPASASLSSLLIAYRQQRNIGQGELAALLGYDRSYVSLLERNRRSVGDAASLRRIADILGIPHHMLGVVDTGRGNFVAMLQFADSTIRLAEIARQLGRASDAVKELWPLVARLEARLSGGSVDREVAVVLTQARAALGTALGHVLPEERLAWAARWTGKAVRLADRLGDSELQAYTLRMHGNELRKAGRVPAGVARLQQSISLSETDTERASALLLLARAAGDAGNLALFDQAMSGARRALDAGVEPSMLFNPFSLREVQLRGLTSTGRVKQAIREIERPFDGREVSVAPQWYVIEGITTAQTFVDAGDMDGALTALERAIEEADRRQLPHQVQRALRVIRSNQSSRAEILRQKARASLARLRDAATGPYLPSQDVGKHDW